MKSVVIMLAGLVALSHQACINVTRCASNDRNCRCMSTDNPGGFAVTDVPQFVMLTFDDAVTQNNYEPTYKNLFVGKNKNPSNCSIGGTFFATHEYNNYAELHHLWRAGSEIAVHTITHETATDMWKKANYTRWADEAVGMRNMIYKYAQIPVGQVQGFRAPFLQTAGDATYQMMKNEGFLYDSSLTTRLYAGLSGNTQPIWPFTLDDPLTMDCIIQPCPTSTYPGLWILPMISYFRPRVMIDGMPPVMMPCAMADACIPHPITKDDTFNYFMNNFNRHYLKNRAPFPVFLHESWLKDTETDRKLGYQLFIEELLKNPNVFLVTASEVIEYMKAPVKLSAYKEKRCVTRKLKEKCEVIGTYCPFEKTVLGSPRVMYPCGACPAEYPWLNKP